jgi:hypothetical protein
MRDSVGREGVARAYALLASLLSGDVACLTEFHSRFHFISVVGIPRTGGSYLTAELYRSIGLNPYRVPGAIAHDSFPEARPFELMQGSNSWIATLKTVAEYLTMLRSPQARIVSYTADGMQSLSQQYQERHDSGKQARSFQIFDKAKRRHPDWVELARPAVERVCSAWANVGCMFPIDDIERCE